MPTSCPPLRKILEELLKKIQQLSNVMTSRPEKLLEAVEEKILSVRQPSAEDLNNKEFQKALCVAIMHELFAEKSPKDSPQLKFDYKKLFDKALKLKPDELKKEIANYLKEVLLAINRLQPKLKQRSVQEIEFLSTLLAKRGIDSYLRQKKASTLFQNSPTVDAIGEALTEALRNLYGGKDPRIEGGFTAPVYRIVGNLFGIVNYSGGHEASAAFIDELNSFDGRADPLGVENQNLIRLNSIVGGTAVIAEERLDPKTVHTPFSTKPIPPNEQH